MSNTVIRIESLGKKYVLSHQKPGGYTTLREQITNGAKSLNRRLLEPLGERAPQPTDLEFWALKDVSFEIKQGERVGIIGRNGAGKSTLLKILSRITEPTRGRIVLKGRVASLLEVGTGFHPELTGSENVYLNGAIMGMSKTEIRSKFDEIVAFAEVEKFLDTPVKRYSSGMYVRLAFAVAAHLEPEILIVDEVLAVGDVQFQKKCLGKMEDIGREGRTILFVSHNMGLVQRLCSRSIFLRQGTVFTDGTTTKAVGTYLRTLEKSASYNLLERTERQGKGQVRLAQIEFSTGGDFPSATLVTGQPARFTFHITVLHSGMSCSFTLYDQHGQPVVNFSSDVPSEEDLDEPNIGTKFVCDINELLLVPGRYRMDAGIIIANEWQDHVEAAAIIDVEQGRLGGRPTRNIGHGNVCMHHRWLRPV